MVVNWSRASVVATGGPRFKSQRIRDLFLSHGFNSWMPDLVLNEDLEEIIHEGLRHEFNQWKNRKSEPQGLYSSYLSIMFVVSLLAVID